MRPYLNLLSHILENGQDRDDRTCTGTRSVFGYQMRFDLREGFPLVTTKKVHFKSIVYELLWMLAGHTHVAPLRAYGVTIWDEWATKEQCARFGREEGDLGPVYGHQWRNFGATLLGCGEFRKDGVDQIARLICDIRTNPTSRRHIVTAWNPKEVDEVALPACHSMMQFYVHDGELSCQLYQRSGDAFLGVPFNIASYALLTMMIAQVCDLRPGEFVHTFGDVHLYDNHIEQAEKQLTRPPRPPPVVRLDPSVRDVFEFRAKHITLDGYEPHPAIKAEVAV